MQRTMLVLALAFAALAGPALSQQGQRNQHWSGRQYAAPRQGASPSFQRFRAAPNYYRTTPHSMVRSFNAGVGNPNRNQSSYGNYGQSWLQGQRDAQIRAQQQQQQLAAQRAQYQAQQRAIAQQQYNAYLAGQRQAQQRAAAQQQALAAQVAHDKAVQAQTEAAQQAAYERGQQEANARAAQQQQAYDAQVAHDKAVQAAAIGKQQAAYQQGQEEAKARAEQQRTLAGQIGQDQVLQSDRNAQSLGSYTHTQSSSAAGPTTSSPPGRSAVIGQHTPTAPSVQIAAVQGGRGVWDLPNFSRGVQIEQAVLGRPPNLSSNVPNFPAIDDLTNGVATSIKSIDLAATSYTNPATLKSKILGYAQQLSDLDGAYVGKTAVTGSSIQSRQLLIAVPKDALTNAQRATLADVPSTIASKFPNVTVKFAEVAGKGAGALADVSTPVGLAIYYFTPTVAHSN